MKFNLDQYIDKDVNLTLVQSNQMINGTLMAFSDHGVILNALSITGSNTAQGNNTKAVRFVPWTAIGYLDFVGAQVAQTRAA